MSQGIIDLGVFDLVLVYGLILMSVGFDRVLQAGMGKDLLWSSLRMFAQLLAIGYVLHLIFALQSAWAVLALLAVMAGFAVQTIAGRVKVRMPRFYQVVGLAIFFGCGVMTFFLTVLVIGLTPWYDPRYLIPLAGMVFGNSMTGASLAAERLASEMQERRDEIETILCLGGSSTVAVRAAVKAAYRAALLPALNSMAAMGLVFLPGMMTGQILSGTEPMIAVRYQIAIMCVITGSVALTSFVIVKKGYRSYFTAAHQLKEL